MSSFFSTSPSDILRGIDFLENSWNVARFTDIQFFCRDIGRTANHEMIQYPIRDEYPLKLSNNMNVPERIETRSTENQRRK